MRPPGRDADLLGGRNAPLGVALSSNTPPEAVAPFLDRLSLVVVPFPVFRDGRGFTLARTLRERYGFEADIRAVGHILVDQYSFLLRCGFSTVEAPASADPARWDAALRHYHIVYQAAQTDDQPLSLLRRKSALRTGTEPA